jgi:hypothetical protein
MSNPLVIIVDIAVHGVIVSIAKDSAFALIA